jgi:hypothetical protein
MMTSPAGGGVGVVEEAAADELARRREGRLLARLAELRAERSALSSSAAYLRRESERLERKRAGVPYELAYPGAAAGHDALPLEEYDRAPLPYSRPGPWAASAAAAGGGGVFAQADTYLDDTALFNRAFPYGEVGAPLPPHRMLEDEFVALALSRAHAGAAERERTEQLRARLAAQRADDALWQRHVAAQLDAQARAQRQLMLAPRPPQPTIEHDDQLDALSVTPPGWWNNG